MVQFFVKIPLKYFHFFISFCCNYLKLISTFVVQRKKPIREGVRPGKTIKQMYNIKKPSKGINHEALYYLAGGYDYRLVNGEFTHCEEGRFVGLRGDVIKKMVHTSEKIVVLSESELACLCDWVNEAIDIKRDHIDNSKGSDWTNLHQINLVRYFKYLNNVPVS
jgi:hypothetical protein